VVQGDAIAGDSPGGARREGTTDVEGPVGSEEHCRWELFSTMDLFDA